MRCEEARPFLLRGPHADAEAHLLTCDACFNWLETHDPMVSVLQATRPAASPVPAAVTAGVLQRWQPQRVSLRLGIAAAMGLSALGLALAALILANAPALITSILAGAGNVAGTAAGVVIGLLAVPRALLFDEPAVLALYVAVTVAVCALWARLYQQVQIPRRLTR
jgi:hypothetical protein